MCLGIQKGKTLVTGVLGSFTCLYNNKTEGEKEYLGPIKGF